MFPTFNIPRWYDTSISSCQLLKMAKTSLTKKILLWNWRAINPTSHLNFHTRKESNFLKYRMVSIRFRLDKSKQTLLIIDSLAPLTD